MNNNLQQEARLIESLSSYKFEIGIDNDHDMGIVLSEDVTMRLSDYLYCLENGSVLNGIVATRPIDATMRESRDMINQCLEQCMNGIHCKNWGENEIKFAMKELAKKIELKLKMHVEPAVSKYMTCKVTYKNSVI